MAQLNFPANPDVGDTYEPSGSNVVYTWNGTVWEATVPVNDSAAFVPLSGETAMTGDLQTTGVICNDTGSDTVLIDLKRNSGDMLKVTAAPNVEVVQPLNLVLPDDSALPFRIMEGNNEYLRVTTTDDAEQFTFKKGVTTNAVLTLNNDVTCSSAQDINIQNAAGTALRVMNAGLTGNAAEIFRVNTSVTPTLADFSCAVKLDGDVEFAFSTLTASQNVNVELIQSSNAWDFMSDGDFALRFNTSTEQLITDFDIVNDNNDSVIQLGGTVANPLLKLNGDGSATFDGFVDCTRDAGDDFGYLGIGPGGTDEKAMFVNRAGEITLEMYNDYSAPAPNVTISGDGSANFVSTLVGAPYNNVFANSSDTPFLGIQMPGDDPDFNSSSIAFEVREWENSSGGTSQLKTAIHWDGTASFVGGVTRINNVGSLLIGTTSDQVTDAKISLDGGSGAITAEGYIRSGASSSTYSQFDPANGLQIVKGNTTTAKISLDGDLTLGGVDPTTANIKLNATGTAQISNQLTLGDSTNANPNTNFAITAYNNNASDTRPTIYARNFDDSGDVFQGVDSSGNYTSSIGADGSATFASTVKSTATASTFAALNDGYVVCQNPAASSSNVYFRGRTDSNNIQFQVSGDGSTYIGGAPSPAVTPARITLNANGQAVFNGTTDGKVTISGANDGANAYFTLEPGNTANAYITTTGGQSGALFFGTGAVNSAQACLATDGSFQVGGTLPNSSQISLNADGSGSFVGNIEAAGLTDGTTTKTMTEVLDVASASGICAAFATVDTRTSTKAILAQANIASFTDDGSGAFTFNFTNPMPDTNYAVFGTASGIFNGTIVSLGAVDASTKDQYMTTTSFTVSCRGGDGSGAGGNPAVLNVMVIR